MAAGEHTEVATAPVAGDRAGGALSPRVAAVAGWEPPRVGPVGSDKPLSDRQLRTLDDVIHDAELSTGLRFAAFLGDLRQDTHATAVQLLAQLGTDAQYAVLVAVDPAQRAIEVVTGTEATLRISERGCRLAVLSAAAAAQSDDLGGTFVNAMRVLADQAGSVPVKRSSW